MADESPERDPLALVRELLGLLQGSDISELQLEWEGVRVHIRREPLAGDSSEAEAEPVIEEAQRRPDDGMVIVPSTHVGIFRRDPEARLPSVGEEVTAGTRIAEVEVLRVRNPISAPTDGVLSAFLVEDEMPVEYGQPLALLRSLPKPAVDEG